MKDSRNAEIIELSYLALARIAYEYLNYDGALYYYNKIDTFSVRYPQTLFEMSWTYFMKGDTRNALGIFHSLASPYYSDDHYFADLWVLEATSYLNLCRYDEAKEALQVFKDIYLSQLPYLSEYLASQTDPKVFYNDVVALANGAESALPELFLQAVLADIDFYTLFKMVEEVDAELAIIKAKAEELGPYGADLLAKMEKRRNDKAFEAGLRTQVILKGLEDELNDWDVTATEVSIEIDIAERDVDEICLRLAAQGKPCEFENEEATVLFLVADDWQFWPFEGEYWVDEVGSYKSYLGDQCQQYEEGAAAE